MYLLEIQFHLIADYLKNEIENNQELNNQIIY